MKQTPHVALLPSPGMGHIIPMVEFAKKLIFHNQNDLSITLIMPDSGLHPTEQKPFLESVTTESNNIDIIHLPMPDLSDLAGDDIPTIVYTVPRSLPFIRNALATLIDTTNIVALVVDLFGSAVFDVAWEVNVPPYLFFPSNAMTLSFFLHLPEIDSSFSGAYKDLPDGLVHIPGCAALHADELIESCKDRDSVPYKWLVNEGRRYKMAEGIMVNTFHEMESGALNALQQNQNFPPIFPIGPLVRATDKDDQGFNPTMKWLEQQPHGSVLFVSFGSLGSLSQSQIHELALGLEMSGKRFIWVIRDQNHDLSSLLPENFAQRTGGRSHIVSHWVPQARILAHASTGAFLTHCGWNSVLESVINGVPMIAWPLESDQKIISRLLTSEEVKIAIRVCKDIHEEGIVVGRNEILFSVKKLMEGEEGKEVRKRTKAVMEAAKMAAGDGGASTKALVDLVCLWKDRNARETRKLTT